MDEFSSSPEATEYGPPNASDPQQVDPDGQPKHPTQSAPRTPPPVDKGAKEGSPENPDPQQERQRRNQEARQTRTDAKGNIIASPKEDEENKPELGSTVEDLIKRAFFIADDIGEPEVSSVSPTVVSLHWPSDGSMVIIRLESRRGAWGGVSNVHADDEAHEVANKEFSDQKKGFDERVARQKEAAGQEAHDDAHAHETQKDNYEPAGAV